MQPLDIDLRNNSCNNQSMVLTAPVVVAAAYQVGGALINKFIFTTLLNQRVLINELTSALTNKNTGK